MSRDIIVHMLIFLNNEQMRSLILISLRCEQSRFERKVLKLQLKLTCIGMPVRTVILNCLRIHPA